MQEWAQEGWEVAGLQGFWCSRDKGLGFRASLLVAFLGSSWTCWPPVGIPMQGRICCIYVQPVFIVEDNTLLEVFWLSQ